MKITRLVGAFAALALSTGAVLALASPARATEDGHYPETGWSVQDTTIGADVDWSDCDPGPVRFDAALSAIVDATHVGLTGPGIAAPPHYGTSIETTNLALPVAAGDVASVDYTLLDGASAAGGAVRLFVYAAPDSDTDCTAPAAFAAALDDGSTSGTLSISIPFDGEIGTLGLVYDSSNGGVGGTVRFSDLIVGDTPMLFVPPPEPCQWNDTLTADDEGCQEPVDPTPSPTEEPVPGAGRNADEELAVTGDSWVLPAVAIGGSAVVVGAVVIAVVRRRKPVRFTA